ncbi:MAG: MBL fold metallo-hydrolase [Desulfobacteraceae bacterium]|nr:MBL fold metallo-hydrolase [Desulfobacteraceae bacterium]MBC2752589.1 MBL fold metallo-hydrolase [Desulfobacteraceae bacterium]
MDLVIHRGTREIGGSCVQVTSGGKSILLDAGYPLGDTTSHVDLSVLDFSDVLISHPHKDHYGMIEGINDDKTIHVGELGRKLIDAGRIFMGQPVLKNRFSYYENRKPFSIGPFTITPYLMDHSSVDAFGFLIEAEGKRIYYSGDFRSHGMKEKVFKWFLADPPKNVDVLLLEGTMLSRIGKDCDSESDIEQKMLDILREATGPCFLIGSGQHIDRLCAAFRACKRAGRIFVLDIYTAYILRLVSNRFENVPDFTDKNIRVLTKGRTASSHYSKVNANRELFGDFIPHIFLQDNQIGMDEILDNPGKFILKVSNFSDLLGAMESTRVTVIYSQWIGYRQEIYNPTGFKRLVDLENNPNIDFYDVHTSGHAVVGDLQKLAEALSPKMLIPIHTEHAEDYKEYFSNVSVTDDGEMFSI